METIPLPLPITMHAPIKPLILQRLIMADPIDFEKFKRVKRSMALNEKHLFRKVFMDDKSLSSTKFYPKKQAKKLSLGFNMYMNNLKTVDKLLKRQSSLKDLSLCFTHKLTDYGWIKLSKLLAKFTRLNRLQIHFERLTQRLRNDTLQKLRKHLNRIPKIKDIIIKTGYDHSLVFSLNLIQLGFQFNSGLIYILNERSMKNLVPLSRQLQKIQSLSLDTLSNAGLTDATLKEFGQALMQLKNLQQVNFNFKRNTNLSSPEVNLFLDSLTQCTALKRFKFGVFLHDNHLLSPITHPIWMNQKLEIGLKIILPSTFSHDKILETFANIGSFPTLYNFSVDLQDCPNVTDSTVYSIAHSLQNFQVLKKLNLNFSECQKITNTIITFLISTTTRFKSLESLSINLNSSCMISDNCPVLPFDTSAPPTIDNKLRKLSIILSGCIGLSETSLHTVIQTISSLKNIEDIYLGLNGCEAVNNKILKRIGKGFKQLENLTTLKLEFGKDKNPPPIKDRSLQERILLQQQQQPLLEIDTKQNQGNTQIEDTGFISLGRSLAGYKKLKNMTMDIKDCGSITQAGLKEFCQCFFNLYNLHKFVLNGNLDNPPRELWRIASELDEKLPHRYYFVMQFKRCSSGTERFARGI